MDSSFDLGPTKSFSLRMNSLTGVLGTFFFFSRNRTYKASALIFRAISLGRDHKDNCKVISNNTLLNFPQLNNMQSHKIAP